MRMQRQGASFTVHTPAKLNLFLEILGKRPDGFHAIETVMVSIGLYDSLQFATVPDDTIELNCTTRIRSHTNLSSVAQIECAPAGSDNLVVRAAGLLRDYAGIQRGVHVRLIKRIPVASGLAGGSSDAAATLLALNRFWDLNYSIDDLLPLAAELGSDIGFFVSGASAAICRGRGELIEPFPLSARWHCVVARPFSGLSTAEVYRHCRASESPRDGSPMVEALQRGNQHQVSSQLYNALERPAAELNSDVADLRDRFARESFAGHLLSGSGTARFGLCRHLRHAQSIASRLRAARAGHVFVAQLGV